MRADGVAPGTRYSSVWNAPEPLRTSTCSWLWRWPRSRLRTMPGTRTVPPSFTRADTRVPRVVGTVSLMCDGLLHVVHRRRRPAVAAVGGLAGRCGAWGCGEREGA